MELCEGDDWVEEEIQRQMESFQHLTLQTLEDLEEGQDFGCHADNQVGDIREPSHIIFSVALTDPDID